MVLLQIRNLYSGYGKIRVLFNVNIDVSEGSITAIIGPNGAGKTTLLNSIYGLADIYSGEIIFNGSNIAGLKPHQISLLGIGYVPQVNNIFSSLSVYENLRLAAVGLPKSQFLKRVDDVLETFPKLKELINRKAGTLSGGERRMLAIALALMKNPKLLLLDEVTTDLAPIMVKRVLEKVVELRKKGITILIVEQYAHRALEIADRVYLLASGEIRFAGEPKELLQKKELLELYLGIQSL
ncbi:ABC transporter ATP-binding protein [Ignisphaera sp. 4213-co]|uniref:ABC transporter ATP-binding protein n=1 Tax=Ignisphaera cupida TaxID=3050454 RepID=A0ABD4Z733_9CREN|nr:ABC transporter ATP-binding protein [Ignisphaera sp. 4213-co]MDK6029152.1 ABC transporter ATP-binding protein [Ignisphaera sp. 4213-co]